MDYNFVIYFHYIGIMSIMGTLLTEHIILKPGIGEKEVIALRNVDLIYGIAALVVVATGLLRFFYFGKGLEYYLHNPLFHIKLTLFIVMGILSIFPTIRFLRWKKMVNRGIKPEISPSMVKNTILLIRIELTLLAIIPFLAVLVARGAAM